MGFKSAIKISVIFIVLFFAFSLFAAGEGLKLLKQQYMNSIDLLSSTTNTAIPNSRLILSNNSIILNKKIEKPIEIKAEPPKEPIKEVIKYEPKSYSFTKSAVWGDIQVNLIAYEKYCFIKIKSTAPIVFLKIIDITDKNLFEKGYSEKDILNTIIEPQIVYMPAYKLLVSIKAEGTVNTITVPLFSKISISK